MGRAFEYRKARKLKRWGNMSRTFTKIGKEITIAVKAAGPDPAGNSRLRVLLQNAKAANMPKDTVERAIKKATDKDASDYKEIVYEGYGPFGIAIVVETATDNNTRTVANVRSYFNKFGGSLGTSGSLSFLFDHKCVFKVAPKEGVDLEEFIFQFLVGTKFHTRHLHLRQLTLGSSHYRFGRGERHAKVADAVEMHLPSFGKFPAHDVRHSIEHSRHIGFCQ